MTLENLILEICNVVEVRAGFGNELFVIDQENLSEISWLSDLNAIKKGLLCTRIVAIEENSGMNEKCDDELSSSITEEKAPKRTLMDVARSECFQTPKKKPEQFSRIESYLELYQSSYDSANSFLDEVFSSNRQPYMYDCMLNLASAICRDVRNDYAQQASQLYENLANLIWYISPHTGQMKERGASVPAFWGHFTFQQPQTTQAWQFDFQRNIRANRFSCETLGVYVRLSFIICTCYFKKKWTN